MPAASQALQKKIEELSKITYKAITELNKCKACGTCVKYCPLKIRIFNDEGKAITIKNDHYCGGCSLCYHRCPQNAIKLMLIQKK